MDIKERALTAKQKISDTLEDRLDRVEDFISRRGIGSSQLRKAKKVQRNINLAIAAGSLITVAGIAVWALSSTGDEDDDQS
ncbi:MAG: hypothetical protein R3242_10720 [Akkermansiaceae bacterium]|nr:hypothetical protein [Akkermansiaceae bacterium]